MNDPLHKMLMLQLTLECLKRGYDSKMSCNIINMIIDRKKLNHVKVDIRLFSWYKQELIKDIPDLKLLASTVYDGSNARLDLWYDIVTTPIVKETSNTEHKFFIYNFGAAKLVMQAFRMLMKETINTNLTK